MMKKDWFCGCRIAYRELVKTESKEEGYWCPRCKCFPDQLFDSTFLEVVKDRKKLMKYYKAI